MYTDNNRQTGTVYGELGCDSLSLSFFLYIYIHTYTCLQKQKHTTFSDDGKNDSSCSIHVYTDDTSHKHNVQEKKKDKRQDPKKKNAEIYSKIRTINLNA